MTKMYRKFFSALTLTLLVLTFAVPATVSARAPLCQDGRFASDDEGCQSQYGIPAVDPATYERCDGFGSQQERANCIANPSINDGVNDTPGTSDDPGSSGAEGSLGTFNRPSSGGGGDQCGTGGDAVDLSINIGCRGQGNPIVDMLFAFVRFLSAGVGIVVIGSIIVAGIQYTTSQGDPNATAKALGRISSAATALLIYIFAAALLNFVIPAGIFN